jgi:hypothetical protein
VRVRVGTFPFTDPASNRRDALALPFVGWWQTLQRPFDQGQQFGLLIALVTIVAAVVVARRAHWSSPVASAALALSLSAVCYGWSVWQYPSEALRVLAPAQVLLFVATLSGSARRADVDTTAVDDVSCVLDLRESSRTTPASPVVDLTRLAREDSARTS